MVEVTHFYGTSNKISEDINVGSKSGPIKDALISSNCGCQPLTISDAGSPIKTDMKGWFPIPYKSNFFDHPS